MIGIGEALKQAREKKKLSLAEAENETKIRSRYLEALEAEEFKILPGDVYTIGFLRNYATFLGLDANAIVAQLKSQLQPEEGLDAEPKPILSSSYETSNISLGKFFKFLAIFLAIILASFYFYSYFFNRPVVNTDPPVEQIPNGEPEIIVPPLGENDEDIDKLVPVVEGIEVVLTVFDEPGARCWIRVEQDNELSFTGTVNRGETKIFRADEKLLIKVGDAGVLSVLYNGKDIGSIGPKGKVLTLEFPFNEINNE